jgi:hypothetical protein
MKKLTGLLAQPQRRRGAELKVFISLCLCVSAVVLILPSLLFSFELRTVPEVSPTAYLRWDISKGPVKISLDSKGSKELSVNAVQGALQKALNAWQGVTRQNLTFQYQGKISGHSASNQDGINLIQWVEKDWQYSRYALGITMYSFYLDDPPNIVDADILINGRDYHWAIESADNDNLVDVQETLIHELGHLIGLSHTSSEHAQMFPYLAGNPTHQISLDDRAAMRFLYGSSSTSFQLVTPVRKATYVRNISARGLPLPVFRWRTGPTSNYILEFSDSALFKKKIQIQAGQFPFYALTAQMEQKLKNLSPGKPIYWRVLSGAAVSPTRSFRFD